MFDGAAGGRRNVLRDSADPRPEAGHRGPDWSRALRPASAQRHDGGGAGYGAHRGAADARLTVRRPRPLVARRRGCRWAPDTAISGLEGLAARVLPEQPLVLLMTTRPEGDPARRTGTAGGTAEAHHRFGPLSPSEARAHAASLLEGASDLERCVERAGGIVPRAVARHAASGRRNIELPSSIKSAILARIDRLDGRGEADAAERRRAR